MSYTERFTEGHKVAQIVPASRTDATVTSSYVSMRDYHRAVALIFVGAIAGAGTVNASLLQAKDTSGTSAKAITGKAITELTASDDDKMVAIELRSEELDVDGRFDAIALRIVTAGGGAALTSGLLIRFIPRFAPVGSAADFEEIVD